MKTTAKQLALNYGMMSVGEVELLQECVRSLGSGIVAVNIGAGLGTSEIAIIEADPDAFVFSVDKRIRERAVRHAVDAGYHNQIVRIVGHSGIVGQNWPFDINLLFVDGGHDVKTLSGDIKWWVPSVHTGGIVLFHDYNHPNLPDLPAVVDEAMKDYGRIGADRFLVAFRV